MKFTFDDGTVLDHRGALLKFYDVVGPTPTAALASFEIDGAALRQDELPPFGRELVLVLGPIRLVHLDARTQSELKALARRQSQIELRARKQSVLELFARGRRRGDNGRTMAELLAAERERNRPVMGGSGSRTI